MKSNFSKLLKIGSCISALVGVALFWYKPFKSLFDGLDTISSAIGIGGFLTFIYDIWIWKYLPLDSMPRLKKRYTGAIDYKWDGKSQSKSIEMYVCQTFTKTFIKLKTNEIKSRTVVSDMVEENGEYFLYYIYITDPKNKYKRNNPMQLGAAKLCIDSSEQLTGYYWTDRKTAGDIQVSESHQLI